MTKMTIAITPTTTAIHTTTTPAISPLKKNNIDINGKYMH